MPRLAPMAWPATSYVAPMPIGLWLLKALDLYRDVLPPLMYEPELFEFQPPPPVGNEGTPEPTEYHPDWPAVEDLYTAFGRSK